MTSCTRRVAIRSTALAGMAALIGTSVRAQEASPAATPISTGFPITVVTANGSTEVSAPAERVVALSYPDVDTVVALGVTPVGVQRDVFTESGIPVWLEGKIAAEDTVVLEIPEEVPIEEIVELQPDLILDTLGTRSAPIFDRLNGIAPTVSGMPELQQDLVSDRTRLIGALLGKSEEAEATLAAIEEEITAFAADHPQLQGKTFSFGYTGAVENIGVIVSPDHFVVQLLSRFGLSVAPALLDSDLPARGAPGSVSISWEQVQLLDADIIMLGFSNPELQQQFEESPLFGSLAAAQRGNFLTITSEMATALNVPSAGNILWTLDQLRDLFQQLDFIREA